MVYSGTLHYRNEQVSDWLVDVAVIIPILNVKSGCHYFRQYLSCSFVSRSGFECFQLNVADGSGGAVLRAGCSGGDVILKCRDWYPWLCWALAGI